MYAEGTASRPPTAKGLADIGVRLGSAGPAVVGPPILMADGSSSGVGFCRAANKVIRIITGRQNRVAVEEPSTIKIGGLESEPCAT